MPVCDFTIFDATLNNFGTSIRAIVVTELHKNLLISWQDLISLKVINENFPAQIQEVHSVEQDQFESTRIRIINRFQETLSDDLSSNPMEIPGKSMHIYVQPNAVPNTISIARLVPLRMQCAANQVISDLLKKQVITKVNKPTPWCTPGFFVPKPNGTSVRLVTDYTKLNKFVKRPIHPFPSATEIIVDDPDPREVSTSPDSESVRNSSSVSGTASALTMIFEVFSAMTTDFAILALLEMFCKPKLQLQRVQNRILEKKERRSDQKCDYARLSKE